jgi:hypothetical protein
VVEGSSIAANSAARPLSFGCVSHGARRRPAARLRRAAGSPVSPSRAESGYNANL